MAYSLLFGCDTCPSEAVLIHALEWTKDAVGQNVVYSGSGKVYGLANALWCANCLTVRLFPFVTLNPPADHAVVAYAEAQKLGKQGDETGDCPDCANPLTWKMQNLPCGSCGGGHFRLLGEWETD